MAVKVKTKEQEAKLSADEAFLKKYLEQHGGAGLQDATTGQDISADDVLAELADEREQKPNKDKELNAALSRGEKAALREKATLSTLQQRAEQLDAASDERKQREQRKEQEQEAERLQREEAKAQQQRLQGVRDVTRNINRTLETNVQPALQKVGALPTLGGIGLMVGILAVLLLIVVRVNAVGDTRLKQFWYMLNGRATLQGRVAPQTGSQLPTGGGGPSTTTSAPSTAAIGGGPVLNGNYRMMPNLGF